MESMSSILLWQLTKPIAEELGREDRPDCQAVMCDRSVAVTFFRNLYYCLVPGAEALSSTASILDYSRMISHHLERSVHGYAILNQPGNQSHVSSSGSIGEYNDDGLTGDVSGSHDTHPMTTILDGDLSLEEASFPLPADLQFGRNPRLYSPPIQSSGLARSSDLSPEPGWASIPFPPNLQSRDLSKQRSSSINESAFDGASIEHDWALFPLPSGEMAQYSVDCDSTLSQPSQYMEPLSATSVYTESSESGSGYASEIDLAGLPASLPGQNNLESNPNGPPLSPSDHWPSDTDHVISMDAVGMNEIPSTDEVGDGRFPDTFSDLVSENTPSTSLPPDDAIGQIGVYSNGTIFALRDEFQRQFHSATLFHRYGTLWSQDHISHILSELEGEQTISQLTINYMVYRLRELCPVGNLYVEAVKTLPFKDELFSLKQGPDRVLIPVLDECGGWYLVEIHLVQRAITHYTHSNAAQCPTCKALATCLDKILGASHGDHPWTHDWCLISWDSDSGFELMRLMHNRVHGRKATAVPSQDLRLSLARDLVEKFSHAALSDKLTEPWCDLDRQRYRGLYLDWQALVVEWGVAKADELFQLAFNIASPSAFCNLQKQLKYCRNARNAEVPQYKTETAQLYHLIRAVELDEGLAQTRHRLALWKLHQLVQAKKKSVLHAPLRSVIGDFCRDLEPHMDQKSIAKRITQWYNHGWTWYRIAERFGSPLVLCLLPHRDNYIAGRKPVCPTQYRELNDHQIEKLTKIVSKYRPSLMERKDDKLVDMLLHQNAPSQYHPLELLSEESLRHRTLDSFDLQEVLAA